MTTITAIFSNYCTQLKIIEQRFHSLYHMFWVLLFIFREINIYVNDSVLYSKLMHSVTLFSQESMLFVSYLIQLIRGIRRFLILIPFTFDGLVQDCSNSSALAMEVLQSCAKPSIWCIVLLFPCWCVMLLFFRWISTIRQWLHSLLYLTRPCVLTKWHNASPQRFWCK